MKIYIVSVAILLFIFCHKAISKDTTDIGSTIISSRISIPPGIITFPPHFSPIPDTIGINNITNVFITENDRFFRKRANREIEAFPSFGEINYLANFLYDAYLENPNGYIRIIIHPNASVQTFIFVIEQINLFEKIREGYALQILGISRDIINDIKRQNMNAYNKFVELARRTFIWIELWDKEREYETGQINAIMTSPDFQSSMSIDFSKIMPDEPYQISTALPSDTMIWYDIIKIYVWKPDSIIVDYRLSIRVVIDGKEMAVKRAIKGICSIITLGTILNERRIRCPRCLLLFYINRTLDSKLLWEVMTLLHNTHVRIMYFAVIPRESYLANKIPESLQVVFFDIENCLTRPTISHKER